MADVIRTMMQEVMDEYRPVLAPESPEANAMAEASPFDATPQPQAQLERPTGGQQPTPLPAATTAHRHIFPLPSRVAPPPPVPITWLAAPVSDSPSTSTFDLEFANPIQAATGAPAVLYGSVDEMTESWAMEATYANRDITFEELLRGAGSAEDMQP